MSAAHLLYMSCWVSVFCLLCSGFAGCVLHIIIVTAVHPLCFCYVCCASSVCLLGLLYVCCVFSECVLYVCFTIATCLLCNSCTSTAVMPEVKNLWMPTQLIQGILGSTSLSQPGICCPKPLQVLAKIQTGIWQSDWLYRVLLVLAVVPKVHSQPSTLCLPTLGSLQNLEKGNQRKKIFKKSPPLRQNFEAEAKGSSGKQTDGTPTITDTLGSEEEQARQVLK